MTPEPTCTCDGRQEFVCCDIRNEPHLVGCPRWGAPLMGGYVGPGDPTLPDDTHWYDQGGVIPPGLTRVRNDGGKGEEVRPA